MSIQKTKFPFFVHYKNNVSIKSIRSVLLWVYWIYGYEQTAGYSIDGNRTCKWNPIQEINAIKDNWKRFVLIKYNIAVVNFVLFTYTYRELIPGCHEICEFRNRSLKYNISEELIRFPNKIKWRWIDKKCTRCVQSNIIFLLSHVTAPYKCNQIRTA